MSKEIMGKTHCDEIGDYFRSPFLTSFINTYYQSTHNDTLTIWENRKEKEFTPEFYEFIREIFTEKEDMKAFLAYIRMELLKKPNIKKRIYDSHNNKALMRAMLCIDDIYHQIKRSDGTTRIQHIFQTSVNDIIMDTERSHIHNWDREHRLYPSPYLGESILAALENDIMPISSRGDILGLIEQEPSKNIMGIIARNILIDTDDKGEYLDSNDVSARQKTINKINSYKKILDYFEQTFTQYSQKGIPTILLNQEEKYRYDFLMNAHLRGYDCKQEEIENGSHEDKDYFIEWLSGEIELLEKNFKKIPVQNTTEIDKLDKKGIKPGPQTLLTKVKPAVQEKPERGTPQLTIVRNK